MKIAVPSNDGATLSEHFGRSLKFLVFEVENGKIKSRETRANQAHHASADAACHDHSAGSEGHNHSAIVTALAGCEIVLCGGIGWRAAEALRAGGISPVSVSASGPAEEIVAAYAAGTLTASADNFCHCHH
jgi:predicted Fe-Mo cluster-binding NifX family protein